MMPCSGIGSGAGTVRSFPRIGPRRPQLPRRLAGAPAGTDGVARPGGHHLVAEHRRGFGLGGCQPHRTGPGAGGTHRHAAGHLPPGHDPAGGEHRHLALNRPHHLGNQDHGGDFAAMATRFGALRDDDVHPSRNLPDRMLPCADQRGTRDAGAAGRVPASRSGGTPKALAISRMGWRKATSISFSPVSNWYGGGRSGSSRS